MFNTENLLRNEVFPAELPPCFSTDDLAANATLAIATSNSFGQGYSIPLTYSGYKSESSRRKFALPNPYHYCKAVDFIVKNESQIKVILEKSKYSLTAPIERQPRQEQPYAKRSNTVLDTKREIECLFQENRYEIRLDINAFFDNIYTHCIPWVVHGIAVAKKHRNDMTLLGNQLDKLMRALNYDQTNGILVGNAVSRIISEIILCSVLNKGASSIVSYNNEKHRPGYRLFGTQGGAYFTSTSLCSCFSFSFSLPFSISLVDSAGFHRPRPNSSAAASPQSLLSSLRLTPSVSPRTPRGYGRKHCGRVFYRRAIWESSGLQTDGR